MSGSAFSRDELCESCGRQMSDLSAMARCGRAWPRKLIPKAWRSMNRSRFEVWSVDVKFKARRFEADARTFDEARSSADALRKESANDLLIADRWQLLESEVGDADLTPAEADAARVWRSWA